MGELELWATSGAMWLTGRSQGPPLVPHATPATQVAAALERFPVDVGVLGERAAYAHLQRNAPSSCGGAMRVLPTNDGHVALSLSRQSDLELIPALLESSSETTRDPWVAVTSWAARISAAEADERLRLLGLAGGALGAVPDAPLRSEGVQVTVLGRRLVTDRPLVVDLTSLWAGPLCAHLLGLTGARVIKVESVSRPDSARQGSPEFFDLLHQGHAQVALDFNTEAGRLRELMDQADLVLEASRPRALLQLGIDAAEVVGGGTSWLSITAQGRDSDAVGFGDDVAARAGLVIRDGDDLLPVGDAIADPMAGAAAASAAIDALRSDHAQLIDVSMLHVAAASAGNGRRHDHATTVDSTGQWWVEDAEGRFAVCPPRRRQC